MKLLLCSATMHFADPCYLFLSWKELIRQVPLNERVVMLSKNSTQHVYVLVPKHRAPRALSSGEPRTCCQLHISRHRF